MIADWYFDFVSPFAYLQSEQLGSLPPRVSVRYRPVLFAALLGASGQKGPAEIVAKRAFTYRFCIWRAKTLGIPLRFPPEHPFNPLPLLRLAIACDSTPEAVHRIFRFVWRDGRLPDLPIEWAELAGALGLPDADARIATAEVPTLAIGAELFWGADATAMAADYVTAGCRYADPEYERVAALPVGATRRDDGAKPVRRS
jgi:2-hydroxychromene-2-carboxylate isomerase